MHRQSILPFEYNMLCLFGLYRKGGYFIKKMINQLFSKAFVLRNILRYISHLN
jgi:hypothetical protein